MQIYSDRSSLLLRTKKRLAVNCIASPSYRQMVLASAAVLPSATADQSLSSFALTSWAVPRPTLDNLWLSKVARCYAQKNTPYKLYGVLFYPSDSLLSQAAARQVSSAPRSLTTVFGMGTGVSSASSSLSLLNTIHPDIFSLR